MAVTMDPAGDRSADFGARMKRLREERGVALRDIAETTKISVGMLEALERNDVSRLPGGIFSRGFVRAYAEQIGADPDVVVRDFIARFPHDAVADGLSPAASGNAAAAGRGGRRMGGALVIVLLTAVVAAAAAGAWWFLLRA